MPIYLAIPLKDNDKELAASVARNIPFPTDSHVLQNNKGWLVKFDGTTIELCNKLEITGQDQGQPSPVGSCLVVPVNSYYGRGPTDMWEWLEIRSEE